MNSNGAMRSKLELARRQAEERLKSNAPTLYWARKYHLNSRGENMSFERVPYLLALYIAIKNDNQQVVEKSVQCGLSELYICQSHVEAAAGLTVMYVLPKYELRNRFVNNRIYKLHKRAPEYSRLVRSGAGGIHRTSLIHFGKGTISYVGSNVESEFIEMPIDSAFVDEKDRCNLANLELLPDRYTASPYKFHREISNPTVEGYGIDERYQKSSQGLWNIKCPHCGRWFNPDFFNNVVQQVGPRQYIPRDPTYDAENEKKDIHVMCECGRPIRDRCMDGEYVHKYPMRNWQGYRISKILNKFAPLRALYDKWVEAQGNEIKTQVVYNSDLGLPYSSKGAKITREDLDRVRKNYSVNLERAEYPRILGVDVGSDLNYVLREIVKDQGIIYLRLLAVGTVPTFELLCNEVIDRYRPKITVIDANPEIHKVQELKAKYSNIYSSQFQEGNIKIVHDKGERIVKMDRTAILDSVKANIDRELYINPMNAEFLDNGEYYSQMTASTRILDVDENNPEKSRFVWVHTQPDHYFLTEGYCLQALTLVPNIDGIIDFFNKHKSGVAPATSAIEGLTQDQRKEVERQSKITPEQALETIRKMHMKK
jgi:hypothetical protein